MTEEAEASPWLQRQPTREDVRAAYRLILGREPEDDAVLDRTLAQLATNAALRRRFFASDEFRAGEVSRNTTPLVVRGADASVESDASPEALARMLERTGRYWGRIGETDPWWSVLTQDRFRARNIAANRQAFYQTGAADAAMLKRIVGGAGRATEDMPLCIEFGCGAGRVTVHLARLFPQVIGCDISAAHLALAAQAAERRGVGNVGWHHSTIAAPMPAGRRWDVWFTRIVLQHNPPPVIAHLLRLAFAGLAPGGLAVFQVPTFRVGYAFSIETYLAKPGEPDMEMHVLPQRAVFALAREAGLEVVELIDDSHTLGNPALGASHIFVFRRPA